MPPEHGHPPPSESGRHRYHSRHRTHSHQQAHADAAAINITPVIDHALVPTGEPELIATPEQLARIIEDLRFAVCFGYDTEFIGEHTYHPKLCLIQIATTAQVALIDPLAISDLTPFWELLADPIVQKIVHAGQHDLEPVARHLGRPPRNIFDTQVAAAFIGLRYPMSTARLIFELTGAQVPAGLKVSQWDHRPLSAVQVHYAANDVRYLPLLRTLIGQKLQAKGTAGYADQECQMLSNMEMYQFDADSQRVRSRGVASLRPRQKAILQALLRWREQMAERADLPPRSFLRDEIILALAGTSITSIKDLQQVRGLPRPVRERHAQEIVEIIVKVEQVAGELSADRHRPPYDRHADKARIDSLWRAVREHCIERGIDPAVVASRKELAQLVWISATGRTPANLRITRGWRRELLGPVLGDLMK